MTTAAERIQAHLNKKFAGAIADAPAPKAPPIEMPKPVAVVAAGEVAFSTVFGFTPKCGDFGVLVCKPEDFDPSMARFIPKVDTSYVVQQDECVRMVAGIMDNDKTLITGPTGSGKSSLCKYVAAKLGRPFIRVNMTADIESGNLFGQQTVEGGAIVWHDGPVTEAAKHGAILLVDEWELMPSEVGMGMQNLLEDGGYLYLKEKPGSSDDRTVVPNNNFRLIYAGNTVGQGDITGKFAGAQVQNSATIDRFTNTIRLDYLSEAHEVAFIQSRCGLDKGVATNMVRLAAMIRAAYDEGKCGLTASPRLLINWGNKMKRYGNAEAFDAAFLAKLNDEDKAGVQMLFNKVFG